MLARVLPLRLSARRVIVFAALSLVAAVLTLLFISAVPAPLSQTDGGSAVSVTVTRSQLLPQDCVTVQWNVDNAQSVALNQQNVAASGSRQLCSYNDVSPTLNVTSQDNSTHTYTLTVRMIFGREGGSALVTLALFIIALALALFIPAPQDYLLITLLIFITSIPLFMLRAIPLFDNNLVQGAIWLAWLLVAAVWIRRGRGQSRRIIGKASFRRTIAISGLLIIFTIVGYYIPMKQHFYSGENDDGVALVTAGKPIWFYPFDASQGRPYSNLAGDFAFVLSPNTVDGFLWIALFEHFLQAVLIFALVRKFFPHPRSAVPLIAAILFIVWPAELSRYIALAYRNYFLSIFLLVVAVVLYLHSYQRAQRWLLATSCVVLGAGLLIVETGFFLSALVLFLPLLLGRRRHLIQWSFAWIATNALLAARLGFFLFWPLNYQIAHANGRGFFSNLSANLHDLMIGPLLSFLDYPNAVLTFALYGLLTVVIVVALLWIRQQSPSVRRRNYVFALLIGLLAWGLAAIPYFTLNYSYNGELGTQPLFRSQYYTTPIIVILWALLIELVVSWLPGRVRRVTLTAVTAVIVMLAITGDLQYQADGGFINKEVTFPGLTKTLQDIQRQLPTLQPGTALVFNMADDVDTPFGSKYQLAAVSCVVFGSPAYQGKFVGDGFDVRSDDHPPTLYYSSNPLTFQNPVVFNVTKDWQIIPASMPAVAPSSRTQAGSGNCAEVLSNLDSWPPVSPFSGPGLRFFR